VFVVKKVYDKVLMEIVRNRSSRETRRIFRIQQCSKKRIFTFNFKMSVEGHCVAFGIFLASMFNWRINKIFSFNWVYLYLVVSLGDSSMKNEIH